MNLIVDNNCLLAFIWYDYLSLMDLEQLFVSSIEQIGHSIWCDWNSSIQILIIAYSTQGVEVIDTSITLPFPRYSSFIHSLRYVTIEGAESR